MSLDTHNAPLYPCCIYLSLEIKTVYFQIVALLSTAARETWKSWKDLKSIPRLGSCMLLHVLEIPQVSLSPKRSKIPSRYRANNESIRRLGHMQAVGD